MAVRLTPDLFDPGVELSAFHDLLSTDVGAVVSFTGVTRDVAASLDHMEIEHYPGMTGKAIEAIAQEARDRWDLHDVLVIHRHGKIAPGEVIMMVATAAAHRRAAFEAADFLMDFLKSRAPFWKKEVTADGADWVAAKDQDEQDLARWNKASDIK